MFCEICIVKEKKAIFSLTKNIAWFKFNTVFMLFLV